MRLNASDSWGRRRFSGFHEVGHPFQPGYRQMTLFRCDPSPTRTAASQPEQLADAAAAELLLPRRFFLRDLIEADSGWDGIEQIASHYDASLSATALRAVHLAPRPTLLVVLEPGVRKEERGRLDAESKLRVTTSASSGSFHLSRTTSQRLKAARLNHAFNGEIVEDITSLNELGINSDRLHVSARLFPSLTTGVATTNGSWRSSGRTAITQRLDMDEPTVDARIRQRRNELGLTLSALAEKAGVAKSYLSNLENSKHEVRPSGRPLLPDRRGARDNDIGSPRHPHTCRADTDVS